MSDLTTDHATGTTRAISPDQPQQLHKTLGPLMLWGLGVGYVISGEYFGWNLGLPHGGTLGLLIAAIIVSIMAITFVFSYAELACAMPRAGGAFVYSSRALGPGWGFLGGSAQIVEFVFAPPAIAAGIGAYFLMYFPSMDARVFAVGAYLIFTALNIWGVKQSAVFELVITIIAVAELLVFAGVTMPSVTWANLAQNSFPNGWSGVFAALPFAIWFFLAIEGIANVAEETKNPKKDIPRGFGWAIFTLVFLAILTLICAVGVDGWHSVVYRDGSDVPSDSPLPLAFAKVVGESHPLFHMLVTVGLFGFIASFNGIVLVAGRAIMEFGRVGYAPSWVGKTHPKLRTPAPALMINFVIGIVALMTGKTGEIITLAVFGAMTLYAISMVSVFVLRRKEPELERPFRAPFYPWFPAIALVLSLVCLTAITWYNLEIAAIYVAIIALGYLWYFFFVPEDKKKARI